MVDAVLVFASLSQVTPTLGEWGGLGSGLIALLLAAMTHLAWPATVLLLARMFREPVGGLLRRLETGSYKGSKVTFKSGSLAERLVQAEATANTLGLPQPILAVRAITLETTAHEAAVTQGLKAAAKRPNIVIADAWQFLMDSTGQLVEDRCNRRPATADVISAAAQYVDSGTVNLMALLTSIANVDIVGGSAAPGKDDAVRYVNLVSRVHQQLAQRLRQSGAADRRDATHGDVNEQ